jgi:hypothetical protein
MDSRISLLTSKLDAPTPAHHFPFLTFHSRHGSVSFDLAVSENQIAGGTFLAHEFHCIFPMRRPHGTPTLFFKHIRHDSTGLSFVRQLHRIGASGKDQRHCGDAYKRFQLVSSAP